MIFEEELLVAPEVLDELVGGALEADLLRDRVHFAADALHFRKPDFVDLLRRLPVDDSRANQVLVIGGTAGIGRKPGDVGRLRAVVRRRD